MPPPTVNVHLVGGPHDGQAAPVPLGPDALPSIAMGWPVTDIPWCPLLVYVRYDQRPDGAWIYHYRGAMYGGW